jgi:hypothetical protein
MEEGSSACQAKFLGVHPQIKVIIQGITWKISIKVVDDIPDYRRIIMDIWWILQGKNLRLMPSIGREWRRSS